MVLNINFQSKSLRNGPDSDVQVSRLLEREQWGECFEIDSARGEKVERG